MAVPRYIKLERILLQNHADMDERWVQVRIAQDPNVLGLGDLVLTSIRACRPQC